MAIAGERPEYAHKMVSVPNFPLTLVQLDKEGEDGWKLAGFTFVPLEKDEHNPKQPVQGIYHYIFRRVIWQ
ncbi:MAG: hypothetical protein WEC39_01265 [Patescibacteria group bacterium]